MYEETVTESDFIAALSETVRVQSFASDDAVVHFATCWIALGRLPDLDGWSLGPVVSMGLIHATHLLLDDVADNSPHVAECLLERAVTLCTASRLGLENFAVRDTVLRGCRVFVGNASPENRLLLFNGWDHLVWEDSDYTDDLDQSAMDSVIGTYAILFGLAVSTMDARALADLSEDLITYAHNLRELTQEKGQGGADTSDGETAHPQRLNSSGAKAPTQGDDLEDLVKMDLEVNPKNGDETPWSRTFREITAKRECANSAKEGQSKPFYTNDGADYLAEAVARTLHLVPKPVGITPDEWVRSHPDQVVFVDACRVVLNPKPTLANSPQSAIRGRLKAMCGYFPQAELIGVLRDQLAGRKSFDGVNIDERHTVALFRCEKGRNTRARRAHQGEDAN